MNISSQYDRHPFSAFHSIEEQFHPPPTSKDLDHLQYHISLQEIGKQLQDAANAAYPHGQRSRYSNVYVLLLCWEDEDPKLPVSIEVRDLHNVFESLYGFEVEVWKIPSHSSHNEVNRKVLDFVSLGGDSKDDLKIVYYGGHGELAYNRQAVWASRPNSDDPKYRTVKWNGIQHALQEAESDVLLLLDCCASGTATGNTDEGHGVTELIAACGFNAVANPVGPDSFTRALITELKLLSRIGPFTVGRLFSRIICRGQNWMPSGREIQKVPLHVVLTENRKLPRGIQLCPMKQTKTPKQSPKKSKVAASPSPARRIPPSRVSKRRRPAYYSRAPVRQSQRFSTSTSSLESTASEPLSLQSGESSMSSVSSDVDVHPRIAITIRLLETLSQSDFSVDVFSEWLRMMPILVENVKVEAGFASFSTLLLVSLPVAMWCYLPSHPAISVAGIIKSPNLVPDVKLLAESVLASPVGQKSKQSEAKPTPSTLGWGDDTKAFVRLYRFNVSEEDEPYFELLPGIDASSRLPPQVYLDTSHRSLLGSYTCQYPGFCFSRVSMALNTPEELVQHYRKSHMTDHDFRASSPMRRIPSQRSIGTQDSAVGMYDSSIGDPPMFYSVRSTMTDAGSFGGHGLAS
ncbi:hypothetical protein BKA64DRAFT_60605 [Cadophora sp. MPI-SDFR-AT-0126]|nr:hypothetical protein BKA64DRAFT_60605 [Leotiomycetes sp. MPI-SDFR-AT-0126]